ncbi:MAG: DUF5752 family protein [Candidatus Muiribacteriota bacterium]
MSLTEKHPFRIKDCALVAVATGKKAHNIRELKENLQIITPGSIYFHFWGILLRPRFLDREYNNDFATWVKSSIHDHVLAEKLAVIDPTDYKNMEELRKEVAEIIEERLDEDEWISWIKPTRPFYFMDSHIVVFDTGFEIDRPEQLLDIIPKMSEGSIYYHFIDARKRTDGSIDDFRAWLEGFNGKYSELMEDIATLDPYFVSLTHLKEQLVCIFSKYFERGKK